MRGEARGIKSSRQLDDTSLPSVTGGAETYCLQWALQALPGTSQSDRRMQVLLCGHYNGTQKKSWEEKRIDCWWNWQAVSMNDKVCCANCLRETVMQRKRRDETGMWRQTQYEVEYYAVLSDRTVNKTVKRSRIACSMQCVVPFPGVCMRRTYMSGTLFAHTVETCSCLPSFHVCPSIPEELNMTEKAPPSPSPPSSPYPDYSTCERSSTFRFLSRERLLFLTFSSSFSLRSCSAWASKSLFLRSCFAACAMASAATV